MDTTNCLCENGAGYQALYLQSHPSAIGLDPKRLARIAFLNWERRDRRIGKIARAHLGDVQYGEIEVKLFDPTKYTYFTFENGTQTLYIEESEDSEAPYGAKYSPILSIHRLRLVDPIHAIRANAMLDQLNRESGILLRDQPLCELLDTIGKTGSILPLFDTSNNQLIVDFHPFCSWCPARSNLQCNPNVNRATNLETVSKTAHAWVEITRRLNHK